MDSFEPNVENLAKRPSFTNNYQKGEVQMKKLIFDNSRVKSLNTARSGSSPIKVLNIDLRQYSVKSTSQQVLLPTQDGKNTMIDNNKNMGQRSHSNYNT
jgi:hypothetical protein